MSLSGLLVFQPSCCCNIIYKAPSVSCLAHHLPLAERDRLRGGHFFVRFFESGSEKLIQLRISDPLRIEQMSEPCHITVLIGERIRKNVHAADLTFACEKRGLCIAVWDLIYLCERVSPFLVNFIMYNVLFGVRVFQSWSGLKGTLGY